MALVRVSTADLTGIAAVIVLPTARRQLKVFYAGFLPRTLVGS